MTAGSGARVTSLGLPSDLEPAAFPRHGPLPVQRGRVLLFQHSRRRQAVQVRSSPLSRAWPPFPGETAGRGRRSALRSESTRNPRVGALGVFGSHRGSPPRLAGSPRALRSDSARIRLRDRGGAATPRCLPQQGAGEAGLRRGDPSSFLPAQACYRGRRVRPRCPGAGPSQAGQAEPAELQPPGGLSPQGPPRPGRAT